MVAEDEEVANPLGLRPQQRQRGGGRGGLEPDRIEDDLPIRVLLRDLQRVEWRVHHAHVGTGSLGVEQAAAAAGHAHEIAEACEDDAGLVRDGDAVIEAAHGDDAHRAPGSMYELDVARQKILDAVLEDGVGVPTAHLHDLPMLVAGLGCDARAEGAGEVGVAELVSELHAGCPLLSR